jgi:hypothetical protein
MKQCGPKHADVKLDGMTHNTGRRSLLAAIARLPVLLVAAYTGIFPRPTQAGKPESEPAGQAIGARAQELDPHHLAVLERLAWLLFPLPGLAAGPYQRVAAGLADAVADVVQEQPAQLLLVRTGIEQLDVAAGGSFLDLPEPAQVEHLQQIESSEFFQFVYAATRSRLFDDREVWALLGYEGSSLENGGYLNRVLNDIDWL